MSKKYFKHHNALFCVLFLTLFSALGYGQGSPFWDRMQYGGTAGIGFGTNTFNIAVSPSALYRPNPQIAFGPGLNFNYSKFGDFKLTALGGSAMVFYNPVDFLQISSEFEEWHVQQRVELPNQPDFKDQYWYPALFMGLGYTSGNITFGLRYDVLYDESKSLYADAYIPFVRVYF